MPKHKAKTATRTSKSARKTASTPPAKARQPSASAQTKTEACLVLLARAGGATLAELQEVTGWQAHSVRGFLAGTVKKMAGVTLSSEKPENGPRRYRAVKAK